MTHNARMVDLIAAFERQFGHPPEGIAEAPGRVNLIGEHVDYNDGLVLPFAIDRRVLCAWGAQRDVTPLEFTEGSLLHDHFKGGESSRESLRQLLRQLYGLVPPTITFHSIDAAETDVIVRLEPAAVEYEQVRHKDDWSDYPSGVVWALAAHGYAPYGIDVSITGNVPQGAGLSSSAAVEVAVAGALRDAFALDIDDVALARLCQRAENEFVGVQCGIMDQFASALSKRDHALLIDCRTLAYEHVPLRLAEHGLAVVIANSAVRRELASSAYNDRRRECGEAVAELRARLGRPELASLRDVTLADLERVDIDTVRLRRARHVAGEIARVAAAVEALRTDGFAELGRLMGESHLSLRDDYEVSSPELDLLVALATAQPYVLGARLTGAGFGGCSVNLVQADAVEAFERDVIAPYRERTGRAAEMYVTTPHDGLRIWKPGDGRWKVES